MLQLTQKLNVDWNATWSRVLRALRDGLRAGAAVLAQLGDQPAYQRFLERSGTTPSASSWQAFLCERHATAADPRRCC